MTRFIKILLAVGIIVQILNIPVLAEYYPIIFDSQGLNLDVQPMNVARNQYTVLDGWQVGEDRASGLGVLTKAPGNTSMFSTDIPASGRSRGITQIRFDDNLAYSNPDLYYVLAALTTSSTTSEIYKYVYGGGAGDGWYPLTLEVASTPPQMFPYHFSQYTNEWLSNGGNQVFISAGSRFDISYGGFWKWVGVQDVGIVQDVSNNSSVTGTVYFTNGSANITGEGTTFDTELDPGDWIQKATGESWYLIYSVTSSTGIGLGTNYDSTTATSSATRRSGKSSISQPFSTCIWKNRLWMLNNFLNTNRLYCSAAIASAVPQGLEDHTGSDTGNLDVPGNGSYGTAVVPLGDYLFAFKENSYSVYQYNADLLPPIILAKIWNYGCPAQETIEEVDDSLIYFTGNDVRRTNGFQDVSIATGIRKDLLNFRDNYSFGSIYVSTETASIPSAIYDESRHEYHLILPVESATPAYSLHYVLNTLTGKWIEKDLSSDIGWISKLYEEQKAAPTLVFTHAGSSDSFSRVNTNEGEVVITGEVTSGDISFDAPQREKEIEEIEFWIHVGSGEVGGTNEVVFAFNYWKDGVQALATPLTFEVSEDQGDSNYYKKVTIERTINDFNFFRWQLKDITYTGTQAAGASSIVGGYLKYNFLN